MTNYRYKYLLPVLVALAVFTVVFWPAPAHAIGLWDFVPGMNAVKFILQLAIDFMEAIHTVLGIIMSWLGSLLTAVVGNPEMNYGGPAIYVVWKLLRDMCNSLFIVFFILIAFSTIFHTIWKGGGAYYYRSALMNVVLAAILINFSLPIGQTIVFAGNQAAVIASKLMSGQNIGAKFASALKLPQRVSGAAPIPPTSTVPDEITPLNQQGPVQRITSETYIGTAKTAFEDCLKYNTKKTIFGCSAHAAKVTAEENARKIDEASKPATATGAATGAWAFVKGAAVSSWNYYRDAAAISYQAVASGYETVSSYDSNIGYESSVTGLSMRLLSILINNFLMMVMVVAFLFVIVFMVLRVPMIWFLLATSSLAFFTLAVPGSDRLKKWFGDIVGYSIFAPLYLLAIYIGMFVLSQQNTLLSGLKNAAWYDGVVGVFLFYFIAAAIFIGGAGAAWKTAFAWSSDLEKRVTGLASTLGVDEKSNFGINALARRTGITAQLEARKAQLMQKGGDIAANIRGRAPNVFRTQEESEAYRKMKLGVRGADAEYDKLIAKRVGTQKGILEASINKISDPKEKEAYLRSQLASGNRDASLAAGEMLLKMGKLSATERSGMLERYGKISPLARQEASKRIAEQYKKEEFKDVAEAIEALGAVKEDSKTYKDVLKSIAKNQPLVYAELADAGLIIKDDGTKETMSEVLERTASKLSDKDLIDLYKKDKLKDLGENVNYIFNNKKSNPKELQGLLRTADKDTRKKLRNELERGEQETRGAQMASETESGLSDQIRDLNAQGRAASQQYNEARATLQRDSSNASAQQSAKDAQARISQISAQRDQLKAKLDRG